jgi:hypothetical protein
MLRRGEGLCPLGHWSTLVEALAPGLSSFFIGVFWCPGVIRCPRVMADVMHGV